VRLGAAACAPLWVARSTAVPLRQALFGGWLGRIPLLGLFVRWPLQAAVTLLSFFMTMPTGVPGFLRCCLGLLNVLVVLAFERTSRMHFLAAKTRAKTRVAKQT
jgi:hypothetical protein